MAIFIHINLFAVFQNGGSHGAHIIKKSVLDVAFHMMSYFINFI